VIALYIFLFLVLLFTLLCFVKLEFKASYTDAFFLKLKVLFLTFTLLPMQKKQSKKQEKQKKKIPKKKKETKNKKPKKPSYLKKLNDRRGVEGLISAVVELSKLVTSTLKGLFEKVVIERFDINVTIVGDDAADTALKYGRICGAFYSAVSVICGTAKCDGYNVMVTPDFDDEAKASVKADVCFYIRVAYVLKYAIKVLYKLFIIRYKR